MDLTYKPKFEIVRPEEAVSVVVSSSFHGIDLLFIEYFLYFNLAT